MLNLTIESKNKEDLIWALKEIARCIENGFTSGIGWDLIEKNNK